MGGARGVAGAFRRSNKYLFDGTGMPVDGLFRGKIKAEYILGNSSQPKKIECFKQDFTSGVYGVTTRT